MKLYSKLINYRNTKLAVAISSELFSQNGYSLAQAKTCLFKFNKRDTRKRCEICSKITIKTPTIETLET